MKKNLVLFMLSFVSVGLISSVLVSENSFADDDVTKVDEVNITVLESCSVEEDVNSTHEYTETVRNSEYVDDIDISTFRVFCNDNNGFSVYAIGYSNNEFGNTLMKHDSNSSYDFDTGTATSGNTSDWAMKLTPVTGTYAPTIHSDTSGSFSNYHVVPTTYTKVASFASNTDMPATGANALGSAFQTTYAVWISADQVAGTYEGKVKYTLVHPATEIPLQPQTAQSGCINYFPNGGNVEGTMGCQTISSSDTSATLLASNFSRAGYGFAGWSDKYDYATNPNAKFYGPNETITFTAGQYTSPNNGLSLYAVWVKSQGSLQDTTKVANICNSLTAATGTGANLSSVSALTDQRDGNTYAIAKLADNKCWMIENLRLESADTVGNNRFDSSITNQSLAQGYGTSTTYGDFSGLANAESADFSNSTTANSLYYSGTQSGTASINIGTSNYPGYRMPRYNNTNTSARANSPTSNSGSMYSYGNYYTWHAAIADLTYSGTDNQSATGTSLCPTGWHLPTGGRAYASSNTSGVNVTGDSSTFREFYNLGYAIMGNNKTAYEDTPNDGYGYYSSNTTNPDGKTAMAAFRSFPNNFLYSGSFNTSSAGGRGSYGIYWSSTALSNVYSYDLLLTSSYVSPGTDFINKYGGRSIRCLVTNS